MPTAIEWVILGVQLWILLNMRSLRKRQDALCEQQTRNSFKIFEAIARGQGKTAAALLDEMGNGGDITPSASAREKSH